MRVQFKIETVGAVRLTPSHLQDRRHCCGGDDSQILTLKHEEEGGK